MHYIIALSPGCQVDVQDNEELRPVGRQSSVRTMQQQGSEVPERLIDTFTYHNLVAECALRDFQ